jgi:hypothetical protein
MKRTLLFFFILFCAWSGRGQAEKNVPGPAVAQNAGGSSTNMSTNATGQIEMGRAQYSEKLIIPDEILSAPFRKKPDLLMGKGFTYSGAAVLLAKTPTENLAQVIKHPLELINPFAPATLGTGSDGRNAWNDWNPWAGTRPSPHAFRDPLNHEPQGALISIGK